MAAAVVSPAAAAEFSALGWPAKSSKFGHSPARCAVGARNYTRKSTARLQVSSRSSSPGAWPSAGSRHWQISASREAELPSEILEEDSNFVPINEEDPRFGPAAILLLGFTNEEAVKVQDLLKEMEGEFMQVLLCTEVMAKGTLGKALDAKQPNLMEVQVANGLPRISFLSGLTGEEIMMMIQIYPQAGLERTVFAAHVPLNSDKSMQELIEEIMDDHQRLSKRSDDLQSRRSDEVEQEGS